MADEHAGPRAAPREALPDAFVQRRHVRLPRDAPDRLPREADDDCPKEPRRTGARPPAGRAGPGGPPRAGRGRAAPAARLEERGVRHDRPTSRVGEDTGETFARHRPPRRHREHTGSADMPERSSEETERRTRVVRIFPNAEGCPRPVPALAVGARESRPGAGRHPTTDDLGERKKPRLRRAA